MDRTTLVRCNCSSNEHIVIFDQSEDEPDDLYASIHLTKHSFFKRLWYALKYIFGYQCKYGAFENMIFDKDTLIESIEGIRNPGKYGKDNTFMSGKEWSQFQRNTAKLRMLHHDIMDRLSEVLDCKVYVWSNTGSYTINVRLEEYGSDESVELWFSYLVTEIEAGHTDFKYFKEKYGTEARS